MTSKTLKTLVLKTVTVGSAKLPTPADRIGLGFTVVATYPAEVLSSGQFPLPHNPEPEQNLGSRQELSAMQMHEQMQVVATAAAPAGSAGCLPNPGSSAVRSSWSRSPQSFTGWRLTTKQVGRASFHAGAGLLPRLGRDCQSPSRRDDRQPPSASGDARASLRTWELIRATAAGK